MSEVTRWAVVNVGCIECGVSSKLVGVFATRAEAEAVEAACDRLFGWREGGQNAFYTFELPPVGVVDPEYREALEVAAAQAAGGGVGAAGMPGDAAG